MGHFPIDPKISVIVPVYKVEPYLDHCIFTIVNQSYRNLEIILVDDGSPDGCPQKCDSWAAKDDRISVIHKENGGLSDARNVGLEVATGEYILFIDSDDYISLDMCRLLINEAIVEKADIVSCNLYWTYPDGKRKAEPMSVLDAPRVFRGSQIVEEFFAGHSADMVVVWNKLFKRELFFTAEKIRFPKGRYHEDEYTTYRLFNTARTIAVIPEKLYYYVQRSGSITSKFTNKNLHDIIDCIKEQLIWAKEQPEMTRNNVAIAALNILFYMDYQVYMDKELDADYVEQFRKHLMKDVNIAKNPSMNSKMQIKWQLYCWHILSPAMKSWRKVKRILGKGEQV